MRKILVYIPDGMSGVGYWRFYRPFAEMRKQFRGELDFEYRNKMYIDDIYKFDLVIFSRPSDDNALNAMRVCAGAGIPTILDIDDDLINLPKEHPLFWDYYTAKNNLIESFLLANAIWVSTEQLLYVTDSLKKGVIVKNAILPSELPDKPAPFANKWCWRGGIASQADLYFARDWYDELKTQASEFHFIGYDGMLFLKHGPSYRFKKWERNTEAYIDGIKKGGFNVIWKPLEDNAFNRSKSNIAWIEATMGGGACLTNLETDEWDGALCDPEPTNANWKAKQSADYADMANCFYSIGLNAPPLFPEFPNQDLIEHCWERSAEIIKVNYNLQTENEKRFQVIKALC